MHHTLSKSGPAEVGCVMRKSVALSWLCSLDVRLQPDLSVLRRRSKVGSFPVFRFQLLSLPGDLIAFLMRAVFRDQEHSRASEFLSHSHLATAFLFGGVTYWALRYRKVSATSSGRSRLMIRRS